MLEKIEQIHALLNVPNVDADTETAITNMKILNLLVDLRAEAEQLILSGVVKSLRDEMAIGFAQTKMQVWDGELTNKHREKVLEDWIRRNGDDLTIAEHIVKDAYFLADEMLRLR
jgi:hypothetical protein